MHFPGSQATDTQQKNQSKIRLGKLGNTKTWVSMPGLGGLSFRENFTQKFAIVHRGDWKKKVLKQDFQ